MVERSRPAERPVDVDVRSAWPAAIFVVYSFIAWMPCLVGGMVLGSAIAGQPADDGVVQGKTMGVSGALPEILISTVVLLAIAYVVPLLYLNRKHT